MRFAILLALAGCFSRSYTGSHVSSPQRDDSYVGEDGKVYVPYIRQHYDDYHDDGGIVKYFSNDAASDSSEPTKKDKVGVVALDLATGACALQKKRPRGRKIQALEPVPPGFGAGSAVRVGDRLFVATRMNGVLELTTAPVAKVASHLPLMLVPEAETQWLAPVEWRVGEVRGDAKLEFADGKLFIDRKFGRILLGGDRIPVSVFADRYVAAGGTLVDLKETEMTTVIPHITRLGQVSGELLIESEGAFFLASSALTNVRPFETELRLLGVENGAFLMQSNRRDSVLVFTFATRAWREVSFEACRPTQ